jgi:hypothetical protein
MSLPLLLSILAILIASLSILLAFTRTRKSLSLAGEIRKILKRVTQLEADLQRLLINPSSAQRPIDITPDTQGKIREEYSRLMDRLTSLKNEVYKNSSDIAALQSAVVASTRDQSPTPITSSTDENVAMFLAQKEAPTIPVACFNQTAGEPDATLLGGTGSEGNVIFPRFQEAAPEVHMEPYEGVTRSYQDALERNDKSALRQMQFKELNIMSESEDLLLRGNTSEATRLEAVNGGGSYMIMSSAGHYWLFPTAQTLASFGSSQPKKGIFSYELEMTNKPVVKRPAEVQEDGDRWVVLIQGIIAVPG